MSHLIINVNNGSIRRNYENIYLKVSGIGGDKHSEQ